MIWVDCKPGGHGKGKEAGKSLCPAYAEIMFWHAEKHLPCYEQPKSFLWAHDTDVILGPSAENVSTILFIMLEGWFGICLIPSDWKVWSGLIPSNQKVWRCPFPSNWKVWRCLIPSDWKVWRYLIHSDWKVWSCPMSSNWKVLGCLMSSNWKVWNCSFLLIRRFGVPHPSWSEGLTLSYVCFYCKGGWTRMGSSKHLGRDFFHSVWSQTTRPYNSQPFCNGHKHCHCFRGIWNGIHSLAGRQLHICSNQCRYQDKTPKPSEHAFMSDIFGFINESVNVLT